MDLWTITNMVHLVKSYSAHNAYVLNAPLKQPMQKAYVDLESVHFALKANKNSLRVHHDASN